MSDIEEKQLFKQNPGGWSSLCPQQGNERETCAHCEDLPYPDMARPSGALPSTFQPTMLFPVGWTGKNTHIRPSEGWASGSGRVGRSCHLAPILSLS